MSASADPQEDIGTFDSEALPDEFSAEAEADAVTDAAMRDLETVRERRRSIEAKLSTSKAPDGVDVARSCPHVDAASKADEARLADLRMEVENLRARAALTPAMTVPGLLLGTTECGSGITEIDTIELADPPSSALDDWMEDLRLCNSGVWKTTSANNIPPRAVASPQRNRLGNSLRHPASLRSPPSSPSNKEMARLAEEKAMAWAVGQRKTPRLKAENPSPSRTPKATLQAARGGLLCGGTAPVQPVSTVESQLDDILKDLDEIDRIHDDVCMLAHS
jgi:hypothetical protein